MNSKQYFSESTVWENQEDGICSYFVYGIAVTNNSTVLAFAEARLGTEDTDPHHIVLKRSTDFGATWGSNRILIKSDGNQCWAQPIAIVDRASGKVFFFYCLNHEGMSSQVYYITSTDDGLTWSKPREITSLYSSNPLGWNLHAPGPGQGIQLSAGRLLVPIWHRSHPLVDPTGERFSAEERNYGVSVIYSDDGGETWKLGGIVPQGNTYMLNEPKVVELENGDLLMNMRSLGSKSEKRIISRSTDGGLTWSYPAIDFSIPEHTSCNAGFVRLSKRPEHNKSRILYCWPDDLNERKNLTASISYDECVSWKYSRVITKEASTYSELAILPDNTVLCLYGKGILTLPSGYHAISSVVCSRFNIEWLTEDQDSIT